MDRSAIIATVNNRINTCIELEPDLIPRENKIVSAEYRLTDSRATNSKNPSPFRT